MYSFDTEVNREGTGAIKYDFREKIFGKNDVTPLWVADMDFETPDFIRDAVAKRMQHPIYGYSLREQGYYNSIVNWLENRHGWKIDRDWIIFSPGIVPALNFSTLAYTNPGDKIITQPPVYYPFFSAIQDHNRVLLENQLMLDDGHYHVNFKQLEELATEATMLLLSNPHNPVGRVWTKEELKKIGEICLENNVIIISDEIHSDLILPGFKHVPMASISDDIAQITVTCIAPSKTFNIAGLSTSSVIISNNELHHKFSSVVERLHVVHGNIFGTTASEAGYTHGAVWVDELMEYVNQNFILLDTLLNDSMSKIKLIPPEATYLAWLDFRQTKLPDKEIKELLVNEAGIGLSAGLDFGNGGKGFQRLNLASPRNIVEKSVRKLVSVKKFL